MKRIITEFLFVYAFNVIALTFIPFCRTGIGYILLLILSAIIFISLKLTRELEGK